MKAQIKKLVAQFRAQFNPDNYKYYKRNDPDFLNRLWSGFIETHVQDAEVKTLAEQHRVA